MSNVFDEFAGFGNGHASYMVVGVPNKEAMIEWAEITDQDEPVGGLSFKENNGLLIARFDTCEKYAPSLVQELSSMMPEAVVYGTGQWDFPYFEVSSQGGMAIPYETALEECFEDEGNLRLDIKITDHKSGESISLGDLICFDNLEEVENVSENEEYSYLTSFLSPNEMGKVEEVMGDVIAFHRDLERED